MRETATFVWEDLAACAALVRAALRGEGGQTLAEYGLILTLVAVGVAVPTLILMRTALAGAFGSATDCISRVTC